MSHELEQFENGATAFVSARVDAWHQLGTVVDHTMTAQEVLEAAYLANWNVRKTPLFTRELSEDGVTELEIPNGFANLRTNPVTGQPNVLGTTGSNYQPIQNEEHTDLLDALVGEAGAHYETAGSLRNGREVFVTMKLPHTMNIGGVDPVVNYIAGLNSHDGQSSFQFLTTQTRIVCANTQAVAIANAPSSYKVRHVGRKGGAIMEARAALDLSFKYLETFELEAERMIQQTLTDGQFMDIINQLWVPGQKQSTRAKNAADVRNEKLEYLFAEADTQDNIRRTRWAGYQAITEYVDHYSNPQKSKFATTDDDARALRALMGRDALDVKTTAFNLFAAV